jgi:transcription termination factor Rho
MTVLERSELEASPLADLHAIADQIGLDGFRRLRKADLVDAILTRSGAGEEGVGAGGGAGEEGEEERGEAGRADGAPRAARRRRLRGRRARGSEEDGGELEADEARVGETRVGDVLERESGETRARADGAAGARRAGRAREAAEARETGDTGDAEEAGEPGPSRRAQGGARRAARERIVEGVVELLGNGSAFLRISPPEASEEDIYISAAQVRRCDLVSGDRVSGPVRTPRASERYPSLARVEEINGAPAASVAEGTRYEDLAVAYPSERLELDPGDATLGAIEWLTPIGRGSRVTIVGEARAGKSETLRRLLGALVGRNGDAGQGRASAGFGRDGDAGRVEDESEASGSRIGQGLVSPGLGREGLEVMLVLAGARPEEIAAWREGPVAPAAALDLAASAELQGQAVEHAVDTAKRIAARGGDVVVLIDTLDGLHPHVARRILAAARNLAEGGSLTVVATATRPFGGESTVIALDVALISTGRIPALDLARSGTIRPELLVGEDGAAAITNARAGAASG